MVVHDRETNSDELAWKLSKYFVKLSRADVAAELPPIQRDAKVVDPINKGMPRSFMGGGIEQAIARAAWGKTTSAMELMLEHVLGPPTPSASSPL